MAPTAKKKAEEDADAALPVEIPPEDRPKDAPLPAPPTDVGTSVGQPPAPAGYTANIAEPSRQPSLSSVRGLNQLPDGVERPGPVAPTPSRREQLRKQQGEREPEPGS